MSASNPVGLVVNANAQNPTQTGYYGPGVDVLFVDIEDKLDCDAKQHFSKVNAQIKDTLKAGKSAVVHCGGSVSRAATLTIAYLMEEKGLSACEATSLLKSKWENTFPNDSFVNQLIDWEEDLKTGAKDTSN